MNLVPMIVDKELDGERSYDIFSRLLKNRIILLSGEINDACSSSIIAQLLYLDSISNEDISLTKKVMNLSEMLGIDFLDHVIIAKKGSISLRKEGYVKFD